MSTSRWNGFRRSLREKIAHVTPRTVVTYPFEVLAACVSFIVGVPILAGLARPESLALLLPPVAYVAYGVALVLGAITVAVSLHRRRALGLSSGLQLLGGSFCVYAFAVIAVAGWSAAWAAFAAFLVLGLVSLIRSSHFRRIVDIQDGADRLCRRS